MLNEFSRTELLVGTEAIEKLNSSRVCIFGIGGVGGYVAETLARAGVGKFVLVDKDDVSLTNCNRQIVANHNTIGRQKTEVMKEHILAINPNAEVEVRQCFFLPENEDEFDFNEYDYVVDAVDTVTAKIAIIMKAINSNVPVISSMGAGNKLNPNAFEVSDIYKTSVCPLARVMRYELKKRHVKKLKVVYSKEKPMEPVINMTEELPSGKRTIPGSSPFAPAGAGLLIASEVMKDLIGYNNQ
ncbi:MAG: tRNA threonylcarbamoyladenosine dehydratase [Acholeplasmatales bacterium]|nr:tRNA threonylcarbamoyladenosine dehydratase [Acholeplasmatales bacterium]